MTPPMGPLVSGIILQLHALREMPKWPRHDENLNEALCEAIDLLDFIGAGARHYDVGQSNTNPLDKSATGITTP